MVYTLGMAKPKHRRCEICHAVTARYVRTQNAGTFAVQIWERDAVSGEMITGFGPDRSVRCDRCAEVRA